MSRTRTRLDRLERLERRHAPEDDLIIWEDFDGSFTGAMLHTGDAWRHMTKAELDAYLTAHPEIVLDPPIEMTWGDE